MTSGQRRNFDEVYAGPVDFPPLQHCSDVPLQTAKLRWRQQLADQLYGPFPPPPLALTCQRHPLHKGRADRLTLNMQLPKGHFSVDAALWLPAGEGPWPLLCGLDFIGPVGILFDESFPIDHCARIVARPEYGATDGKLSALLRGSSASNWPVPLLTDAGFAVLVSCYGSWVPDDPDACKAYGLMPLMGTDTGALSLWAWSISRLIDAAVGLAEINEGRITVAGHSRLGKAALWATANDTRISATFASSSGAAGAAPALHGVGETLKQLRERFPHWLGAARNFDNGPLDQHALLALASPGALYLASATEDIWADPVGSYLALVAASTVWPDSPGHHWPGPARVWQASNSLVNGALGFHLRPGEHALLPFDWLQFLAFNKKRQHLATHRLPS